MAEKLLDAAMLDTVENPFGTDISPEEDEPPAMMKEVLTITEDVPLVEDEVDEVKELLSSVDDPLRTPVPPDKDVLPEVVDDPPETAVPPDEDGLLGVVDRPLTVPELLKVKVPVSVPNELLEYGKLPVIVDAPSEAYGPLEETALLNWEENEPPALTEELLSIAEPLTENVVP